MGPTDEHVSFFKQLSVVVSSQLKYHQFRELMAQKATDSCMRNKEIGIIILNDFLCGTAGQVTIYFLEVPVEKYIKSHMKQFLSVNNPAPAKDSMALRVTIALIDSEVKVTKKKQQTTYYYEGCKSKQRNKVNCSGTNCQGGWLHPEL